MLNFGYNAIHSTLYFIKTIECNIKGFLSINRRIAFPLYSIYIYDTPTLLRIKEVILF